MKRKTKITETQEVVMVEAINPIFRDATLAVLIVSLTVNLFFLTAWVTLQVTSVYDSQVAALLFTR